MATGNNGWNPLTRNGNGAMTDSMDLGAGVSVHSTFNFNEQGGITKSHTTFDTGVGQQQVKIYPDGNTSLRK